MDSAASTAASAVDGPQYALVQSQDYHGFLEIEVRIESSGDHASPPGDVSSCVECLNVTVIGECETAAYGLTEQARITRDTAIPHIGSDGWQLLVREPKLTATAFVLVGGLLESISSGDGASRFAAAVGGELLELVSNLEVVRLAQALVAYGRRPVGILERICAERELLGEDGYLDAADLEDDDDVGEDFPADSEVLAALGAAATDIENDEFGECSRVDLTGGDTAADAELPPCDSVPAPVRALRRRLARLVLSRGAVPEAAAMLEELAKLERDSCCS